MKGSMCAWKDMGLWLCRSGRNAEVLQGPLAGQSCLTESQSTKRKASQEASSFTKAKEGFFESFKHTDAVKASLLSCFGLQHL